MMDKEQASRWGRTLVIFTCASALGGISAGIALYVLLPTGAVFAVAAVVALITTAVGVRAWLKLRKIARSVLPPDDDA